MYALYYQIYHGVHFYSNRAMSIADGKWLKKTARNLPSEESYFK